MNSKAFLIGIQCIIYIVSVIANSTTAACEAVSSLPAAATSPSSWTINNATNSSYLRWLQASWTRYPGRTYISTVADECMGMAVHWRILETKIQIAVAVQAKGWAGFGFSETGGMKGSDIVYFSTSDNQIHDAYVLDTIGTPLLDERQQDWILLNYNLTNDGYLIFEVERALNTYDNQDWPIVDDSVPFVPGPKVIGAWGDTPYMSYHGEKRVHTTLQLYPSPSDTITDGYNGQAGGIFFKEINDRSEGSIDLVLGNYTIPLASTTYKEVCFSTTKLISLGLPLSNSSTVYIIGMEFLIPKASNKYTHHIVGYGHSSVNNKDPSKCNALAQTVSFEWGPGTDFLLYPSNAGILVGSQGKNAFTLQIHFDNRNLDIGVNGKGVGVRMYYTTQPQTFTLGTFQVGDPLIGLFGKSVGNGWSEHTFSCPSSCSSNVFANAPNGEVTVVQEVLHMHSNGKRMVNQIIRDGLVVHEAKVDYWDFMQSGALLVRQEPYKLRNGDSIRTTCYYDSNSSTTFGIGSQDEMCIAFLTYYPAQNSLFESCGVSLPFFPVCSVNYNNKMLQDEKSIGRVFGSSTKVSGTEFIGGKVIHSILMYNYIK